MSISDRLFQRRNEIAAANLKAGNEFLASNRENPGVTELPSGLQYEVIHMGDGPKPGPVSKVTCHYHGTLIDGTVFDSSVKRGVPATFPLNAVIKGWTEGLQPMLENASCIFCFFAGMAWESNPVPSNPTVRPRNALRSWYWFMYSI